jgi:hypothetical protein
MKVGVQRAQRLCRGVGGPHRYLLERAEQTEGMRSEGTMTEDKRAW